MYISRDIRPVVLSDKCWAIEAYRSMIVRRIYIRYSSISSSSGFIGNIGDGGINISWSAAIEINNCNPAQNVYYINDRTGEPNTTYKPQSPFYGHKNSVDVVTITPEETTEP